MKKIRNPRVDNLFELLLTEEEIKRLGSWLESVRGLAIVEGMSEERSRIEHFLDELRGSKK
jgi:hypothetical protein